MDITKVIFHIQTPRDLECTSNSTPWNNVCTYVTIIRNVLLLQIYHQSDTHARRLL